MALCGCKDVPIIEISLVDNNKIVYTFENDTVISQNYFMNNKTEINQIIFGLFDPEAYGVLISKIYDKYIVEMKFLWQDSQTYEYKEVAAPARVYKYMEISYNVNIDKQPIEWRLEFRNECN